MSLTQKTLAGAVLIPAILLLSSPTQAQQHLTSSSKGMSIAALPGQDVAAAYSNGAIIQFRHRIAAKGETAVRIIPIADTKVQDISLWIPNSQELFLTAVELTDSQQITFAGSATTSTGSQYRFVAVSGLDGSLKTITDTGNYLATQLTTAADHSFWTIGATWPRDQTGLKTWDNYRVIRHFSSDGQPLGSYLDRWDPSYTEVHETRQPNGRIRLDAEDHETRNASTSLPHGFGAGMAWRSDSQIFLRASRSQIVVLNFANHRFVAIDTTTDKLTELVLPPLPQNAPSPSTGAVPSVVTGAALDGNFALLVSTKGVTSASGGTLLYLDLASIETASWRPLSTTEAFGQIIGTASSAAVLWDTAHELSFINIPYSWTKR